MWRQLLFLGFLSLIWYTNGLPIVGGGGQPVFRGLNHTQQAQLHAILFNSSATRGYIKSSIAKWVKEQNNQTLQVDFSFECVIC